MRYLSVLISVFSISFIATYSFLHLAPDGPLAGALRRNVATVLYHSAPIAESATEAVATTAPLTVVPSVSREPVFNPGDVTWELLTSGAEWEPRDSAASFVCGGRMWIMGGLNGNGVETGEGNVVHYWEATHFNDIWSSEDGVTWRKETGSAPWPARRSMSVAEFNGKLWMLGGWSPVSGYVRDIWQSKDGVEWRKVVREAPFSAREGQTLEVFDGKLWLIGGVNYDERKVMNDIWYSEDGTTWKEATSSAPWSGRWDHATVVFGDRIFLTGGMNLSHSTFKDVWSSKDGVHWELLTEDAPWESRQGHGLAVFEDRIWTIGRLNDMEGGGKNDIWYSRDGISWKRTSIDPGWAGREDHAVLNFRGAVYVLGGMDSDWEWKNDVWVMRKR